MRVVYTVGETVVFKLDQTVGRDWSGNFGNRDDRVDLIGSANLPLPVDLPPARKLE